MKYLKLFALMTVAFSAGEIITQWRAHPEPISLKNYLKFYISQARTEIKHASALNDDPDDTYANGTKAAAKFLMFPNREQ
jgi:hypothetical protein